MILIPGIKNKTFKKLLLYIFKIDSKEKNHSMLTSCNLQFESIVVIIFQSVFHSEMYQNNIFLFFKNNF